MSLRSYSSHQHQQEEEGQANQLSADQTSQNESNKLNLWHTTSSQQVQQGFDCKHLKGKPMQYKESANRVPNTEKMGDDEMEFASPTK